MQPGEARPGKCAPRVLVAGLSLATFAIRWVAVAHAFFHQNGQGPGWVDMAWRRVSGAYGPGYAELYGWIAARSPDGARGRRLPRKRLRRRDDPRAGLRARAQASASRQVAGGVAVALALAPIGARLAQSESYFLPITFLLFIAALALADAARAEIRRVTLVADIAVAALRDSRRRRGFTPSRGFRPRPRRS